MWNLLTGRATDRSSADTRRCRRTRIQAIVITAAAIRVLILEDRVRVMKCLLIVQLLLQRVERQSRWWGRR